MGMLICNIGYSGGAVLRSDFTLKAAFSCSKSRCFAATKTGTFWNLDWG
jgi:hypothetical protein